MLAGNLVHTGFVLEILFVLACSVSCHVVLWPRPGALDYDRVTAEGCGKVLPRGDADS